MEWSKIKKLPVRIFQSVRGPMIGHAYVLNKSITRLYAPANVGAPTERNIMYMPLLFCEEYIDLRTESAAFFGEHPVPPIVEEGYKQFVEEFMKASYRMKPIVAAAGVDAAPVVIEDTPPPAVCGSCGTRDLTQHTESCPMNKKLVLVPDDAVIVPLE